MTVWALSPHVARFARELRGAGLAVSTAETEDALHALAGVPLARRQNFRLALRATLAKTPEAQRIFDRIFDSFWRPLLPAAAMDEQTAKPTEAAGSEQRLAAAGGPASTPAAGPALQDEHHKASGGATQQARLMRRDFAAVTDAERLQLQHLIALIAQRLARRIGRRWRTAPQGPVDLRASLRKALARGGELLEIEHRRRRRQRPRLVVIADVSHSMEDYSRFFLQFIHAFQTTFRATESFVFSTGLSRVTPALRRGELNQALEALACEVQDWAGGTRIAASLDAFVNDHGPHCLGRDTVVMIVSDGWDADPPEQLEMQLQRIGRASHRLIWLDPLAGHPGYFASAAGVHRKSPWVDHCLPARNLESLLELARTLESTRA